MKVKYYTSITQVEQLSPEERGRLKRVEEKYRFRANSYYLSLIDWSDPDDPIRKIIVPEEDELEEWGTLDASNEKSYTVAKGLQHKYPDTALFLVNDVCGGFCRFCFRKRLFINVGAEVIRDITPQLDYIRSHKEITNVLLTGGDPLLLSTEKLEKIVSSLREINHVQIIRIGSKIPAFNPYRIIDDPDLLMMIRKYSTKEKKIYVMTQFNHPRELTREAIEAVNLLKDAGAMLCNQTPLLRGINDDPEVLGELLDRLSFVGVTPYYVFQNRPVSGNRKFAVPIEEGYEIFTKAISNISGVAKRVRYVMSHRTGKIEIAALTKNFIVFKYHRAHDEKNRRKVMVYKRNSQALWFDDYSELLEEYTV
ncbi:lysine 2,3-aminomutase YodO family protein [Thermotoga petrophila RKU-10]|uniref:Lysine 2,3-aminomutase YodO family protein n=1 Tax=Thermotoga petrophila (strain ATCC BAA-489 / DSM 13996 / JCM 10882 / RKU-10) TaxID=590168 RepID=D2C7B0_THEP2|nr:KamA family radical SAM protein [Thermotoga petrophila]ADA66846.1 lysine 2,3-aminomutase YodO family protein [Thermotoga petrophila RKU-10]